MNNAVPRQQPDTGHPPFRSEKPPLGQLPNTLPSQRNLASLRAELLTASIGTLNFVGLE